MKDWKYDFNTLVDRSNDSSSKWLQMQRWNPNAAKGIAPLSVADVDMKTAPQIVAGLQEYIADTVLGYTRITPAYKQAIVDWNHKRHNWEVDPQWIVTSNGVVPALYTAIHAYTQPEEAVLILSPVYYPFMSAIRSTNRQLVESTLLREGLHYSIDVDDLAAKMALPEVKLLFLCSPHNPVGRVWTKAELETIATLALKHNVVVVADEIHYDLIMPGHSHTVFASLSKEIQDQCIVCTAPSKSFNLAGLQASSIIIANPALRFAFQKVQKVQGFEYINALGAKATELAYTQAEDWLDEFIELIWHNHVFLKDYLAKHLPQVTVFPLEGTYLQWLDFSALGYTPDELERKLHLEAQVFLDEGYIFGESGAGYERINIACPTHVLKAALERIVATFATVE